MQSVPAHVSTSCSWLTRFFFCCNRYFFFFESYNPSLALQLDDEFVCDSGGSKGQRSLAMTVLGVRVLVLFFFFEGRWAEINLLRNVTGPHSSAGVSSITGPDPALVPLRPLLENEAKTSRSYFGGPTQAAFLWPFFLQNNRDVSEFSANVILIFFSVQSQCTILVWNKLVTLPCMSRPRRK